MLWKTTLLIGAFSFGCSSSSSPEERRSPPPDSTLTVAVSDLPGEEFHGQGGFTVLQDGAASVILLDVYGENPGTGRETGINGNGRLSESELAILASGVQLNPAMVISLNYPSVGEIASNTRGITGMRLSITDATVELSLDLGGVVSPTDPDPVPDDSTATAVVRGQLRIACATRDGGGNVIGDPMWASSFCSSAKTDLGLSAWVTAAMQRSGRVRGGCAEEIVYDGQVLRVHPSQRRIPGALDTIRTSPGRTGIVLMPAASGRPPIVVEALRATGGELELVDALDRTHRMSEAAFATAFSAARSAP